MFFQTLILCFALATLKLEKAVLSKIPVTSKFKLKIVLISLQESLWVIVEYKHTNISVMWKQPL